MGQAKRVGGGSYRVAISGASGLIGRRLAPYLAERGHHVLRLVRDRSRAGIDSVYWSPDTGELELTGPEAVDAVVHLAGENIAGGCWSAARKAAIRDSRVRGTRLLCEGLARLRWPPRVLIAASAIGYYGDRGEEVLTEEASAGQGFLAEVAYDWEAATEPARVAGVRVVNLRTGIVLAHDGGALARMLRPFKLGLGGRVGNGKQYMSWIAAQDVIAAIEHLLCAEALSGPVNGVAPAPITNAEFAKTLGRVLQRPTVLPLPATIVRLLFGQMGQELLLSSTRVLPGRLQASGFSFAYAELEAALRAELALGA